MMLWVVFGVLLVCVTGSIGLKIYTKKRLDSIDGIVGTATGREMDRGRRGGAS